MRSATAVLAIKFKSTFDPETLLKVCNEDLPAFRDVPGLVQKYYLVEEVTGAISGVYLFETKRQRYTFSNSPLAKSITKRYGVIVDSLRVEQYDLTIVLNDTNMEVSVADEAVTNIVTRHLGSFKNNDLDGVLSDYTETSVLVTPNATYTGLKEIRGFFAELVVHFPKANSTFELDKLEVNNGMAYILWNASTPTLHVPFATDTFVIKDGKIHQQTFAGDLRFIG